MKIKKLVYGVGVNDADYPVQKFITVSRVDGIRKRKRVWTCPYHARWKSMLERCYSRAYHKLYPTYEGCTVCEEWLLFSNFKTWMEKQGFEGKQLDKDLLIENNKIYSPNSCVFIDQKVNAFLLENTKRRGNYKIGVFLCGNTNKFVAQCNNPLINKYEFLGRFPTEEQAHNAWLTRKLELAKMLAEDQDDPRVAMVLIERYENYKT